MPSIANAAFSVTGLGTAGNAAGSTVALTGLNAPVGALIFVSVMEIGTVGPLFGATLVDSLGNNLLAHSSFNGAGTGGGTGSVGTYGAFIPPASFIGYSGATITYTKGTAGNNTAMFAVSVTGVSAIHTLAVPGFTVTPGFGSGTSAAFGVDLSSGGKTSSGDLVIGVTGFSPVSGTPSLTPQSGWTALPLASDGQSPVITAVSGTYKSYTSGSLSYTPTIGNSSWGSLAFSFTPSSVIPSTGFNMPNSGI